MDNETRLKHYLFKNSCSFNSIDDIKAHLIANKSHRGLNSEDIRIIPRVFCNNCIVVHTRLPIFGWQYIAYFITATGQMEIIRNSIQYSKTEEATIDWMEKEFSKNKQSFILMNDTPIYELPTEDVLYIVNNDINDKIYTEHLRFKKLYEEYVKNN